MVVIGSVVGLVIVVLVVVGVAVERCGALGTVLSSSVVLTDGIVVEPAVLEIMVVGGVVGEGDAEGVVVGGVSRSCRSYRTTLDR